MKRPSDTTGSYSSLLEVERRAVEDEQLEGQFLRQCAMLFTERFGRSAEFEENGEKFVVKVAGPFESRWHPPEMSLTPPSRPSMLEVLAYREGAEGKLTGVLLVKLPDDGDTPFFRWDSGELLKDKAQVNRANKMQTLGCILGELSLGHEPTTIAGVWKGSSTSRL